MPQRKDLQVFLDGVTPRAFAAIPPAGSTETVSMVEMPLVMRVLRASELMPPAPADGTELMEVKVLGEFLGGAFDVDSALTEKVKIISAAIRLQGYMAGSTALRKGAVWQRAADGARAFAELQAEQRPASRLQAAPGVTSCSAATETGPLQISAPARCCTTVTVLVPSVVRLALSVIARP